MGNHKFTSDSAFNEFCYCGETSLSPNRNKDQNKPVQPFSLVNPCHAE